MNDKTKQADVIFSASEKIVESYITYLCTGLQAKVNYDKPFIHRINGLYFAVTCDIVDNTYDSHEQISLTKNIVKLLSGSDMDDQSLKQVQETFGFLLYAVRQVYVAIINIDKDNNKKKSHLCIDSVETPFQLMHVGLGIDKNNATIFPVFISAEEQEKLHLEKCLNSLMNSNDKTNPDWEINMKVTTTRMNINDQLLKEKEDVYSSYSTLLNNVKRIGIKIKQLSNEEVKLICSEQ